MKREKNFFELSVKGAKILTREEELDVCKRIKKGDILAEKELIMSSFRTVRQIAIRSLKKGIELDDLIQEGNLGLIHAAKNFDTAENVRFNTYAIFWVKQRIQRYYHSKVRMVRIPVGKETERHTIHSFTSQFFQDQGRNPTIEEIAVKTGKTVGAIKRLVLDTAPSFSLDAGINEQHGDMYGVYQDHRYCPEDFFCEQSEKIMIRNSLSCLTEREQEIVKMRFGFYDREYTLKEVGKKFDLSCEACRMIQGRAVDKIKQHFLALKKSGKI